MPGKFKRKKALSKKFPADLFEGIVHANFDLLERRYNNLFTDIEDSNFNPFLILTLSPAYGITSPLEVAENLQMKKALHGDDTAYGRFIEDNVIEGVFGAKTPSEKKNSNLKTLFSPIDKEYIIEGERILFTIKAGPWSMNQSHANEMIANFPQVHVKTGCKIVLGVTYGREDQLNNKPRLVADSLNCEYFDYMAGKEFWEYLTGVEGAHKHIFRAIRIAQKKFDDVHKDLTFSEKLLDSRLKVAQSIRARFNIGESEDLWDALLNKAF